MGNLGTLYSVLITDSKTPVNPDNLIVNQPKKEKQHIAVRGLIKSPLIPFFQPRNLFIVKPGQTK